MLGSSFRTKECCVFAVFVMCKLCTQLPVYFYSCKTSSYKKAQIPLKCETEPARPRRVSEPDFVSGHSLSNVDLPVSD